MSQRLHTDLPFGLRTGADERCLRFFVDAVELAAQTALSNWGVTPFDGGVRLNAGNCEALTLFSGEARVLVAEAALDRPLRIGGVSTERGYVSSPGSILVTVDTAKVASLDSVLRKLTPAHGAALAISLRRGLNPGARRGHSDGAIEVLSKWVRHRIPLPTFPRPHSAVERWEGAVIAAQATRYERNGAARAACVAHYGVQCACCDLLFEQRYGPDAAGLIHVHHLRAVSSRAERYRVDPVRDLRPVCPNCHAVIHSKRPPLAIADVRKMIRRTT